MIFLTKYSKNMLKQTDASFRLRKLKTLLVFIIRSVHYNHFKNILISRFLVL